MKTASKIAIALGLGLFFASYLANNTRLDADKIDMLTDRLFEFGAVDFVHNGYDGPENDLFDCVRNGAALDAQQSAQYRQSYQTYLQSRQGLFSRLDANLQLRHDYRMDMPNTVGSHGLSGHHDQHDLSALANLADLDAAIAVVETSKNPLRRGYFANEAYKDLTDLMVHLAPAVHSVGLLAGEDIGDVSPQTKAPFVAYYDAMKLAQVADINSADYWAAIDNALTAYQTLAQSVTDRIWAHNGALLHAVSGQWLSLQTVAPRLSQDSPGTQSRRVRVESCP